MSITITPPACPTWCDHASNPAGHGDPNILSTAPEDQNYLHTRTLWSHQPDRGDRDHVTVSWVQWLDGHVNGDELAIDVALGDELDPQTAHDVAMALLSAAIIVKDQQAAGQ